MSSSSIDYQEYPRRPNRDLEHIPGDNGMPVFGQTFSFLRNYKALTEQRFNKYGPISRGNTLFQHSLTLLGPEANEIVLKNSEGEFSSMLAWNPLLDRLFPNGLMLKDAEAHRYDRKILQGAFKKNAIEGYLDTMNPHLEQGVINWPKGKEFHFQYAVKQLLLEVAAEVFLGVEMGEEASSVNEAFVDTMLASMAVVKLPIPGTLWYRGLRGRQHLENFIMAHIDAKRRGEGRDIFSQICHATDEDGKHFSDEAVRDHIIFLLFAAHDTTTSTLCSIVYALAKNPEWQQRLRNEYKALGKPQLDYDDLGELEDSKLVFKEALRMYPAVPAIPRRTLKDMDILGYHIPKNTAVAISPLFTHYMEEYWTEPNRFDPERFSKSRAEDKKHFYQWVPFGGGAHKCLGLNFAEIQTKLFLFHLLSHYQIKVKEGYEMPRSWVPLIFPADGLPVTFEAL
ncbi:cytochrome P450 [Zhongshania guokunii]|uniref:Cytochrome P450 n=1 Tax=Zhongshania guokunii TaxID=641783 RepID=A0ABV3U3Y1_9GAMM